MTTPTTFTGKNIEAALHKASVATGIAVDALRYEVLAGATGGYALIKVTGQAVATSAAVPLVESLSGDPSAPAAEARPERDRGDRGRGRDRGERGGDRGDRAGRDRHDRGGGNERRGERGGDRGDRGRDRGGDRGDRPDRGDRGDRGRGGERGERRPRREEELLVVPQDGPTAVTISVSPEGPLGPFGEKVKEILQAVLEGMGFGMNVVLTETADEVVADLQSGIYHEVLLGRDMELLDAIEHLVEKAATGHGTLPEGAPRKKLHLDSQGHRAKADVDLAAAARHMAERAIAEQRTMKLGPLDPRARRVVHLTLRELGGVITKSEGEGVFRRVCIIPRTVDAVAATPEDAVAADAEGDEPGEG